MIRNLKIKHFLILSFAAILIMIDILGGCSLYFTQRLARQTIQFNDGPHTIQVEIAEIQRNMAQIGSYLKTAIIYQTPEADEKIFAAIADSLEEMNTRIALVQERFSGDKALLENADKTVAEWLRSIDSLKDLMTQNKYDEATQEFRSSYTGNEQKMSEAVAKISEDAQTRTAVYYESAQRSKSISSYAVSFMLTFIIVATLIICAVILRSISVPLRLMQKAADSLAKGDLQQEITFEGRNEFGSLAESMRATIRTLSSYVADISGILSRMASNDMTVTINSEYQGDFAPIKVSLEQIVSSLNQTLSKMGECSRQVAANAVQVSSGAQALSQGASEQAGSVEELSASISEISAQVQQNAASTEETLQLVETVGAQLDNGNNQMQSMLGAISEINNASDQIAKIIKTIEDIAFQTNILALNAAVEAARAGEAGKGFAVVADEVRNLAAKSADAAKSTTSLIQNSIQAVDNGTRLADETAQTLQTVVDGAQKISSMVSDIANASERQANSISQITNAVTQISQVIQNNSAAAEESAASSEALDRQSQVMETLTGAFRLADSSRTARQ